MIPKELSPLSREQWRFLRESTARQNWAHGPVRSGKNFVINIRFAEALASEPFGNEDSDVAFCGMSKSTIYRVFLKDLFQWIGKNSYVYNKQDGTGRFTFRRADGVEFSRDFYSFGYGDADSHENISGSTFGLAYETEGIYAHEDFHRQLMARLSIKGSKHFGDTNPAGPHHWLWKKVINNQEMLKAGDVKAFPFNFDSNLSLDHSYKESLRREFGEGSLWYQRMILGLWVMAEGIIYANSYDERRNTCTPEQLPKEFDELWASCDYGTTNLFTVGLWGEHRGKSYRIDEYVHDSSKKGQMTNGQYLAATAKFLGEYSKFYKKPISMFIVDPSAASFRADLDDQETDDDGHRAWRELNITVVEADNEVEPGIKTVAQKLYQGLIVVCTRCVVWLSEVVVYAWDPKAQARGEDKPIKKDDHTMDDTRYGHHTRRRYYDPYAGYGEGWMTA